MKITILSAMGLRAATAASGLLLVTAVHASTWVITDLGRVGDAVGNGWSRPALNDHGAVVFDNKIWTPGPGGPSVVLLLSSAGNANNFGLMDINNAGQVLGNDLSQGLQPFVWQGGTRSDLPRSPNWAGWVGGTARGINDSGQVVGNTGDTAVVWSPGGAGGYTIKPLGVDLGWTIGSGDGWAINNPGAGLMSQVYNSYRTGYSFGVGATTVMADWPGHTPVGQAMNDTFAVAGYALYNCGGYSCNQPFVWTGGTGGTVTSLPALGSSPSQPANGMARGINESMAVVGEVYYGAYDLRAVLWTPGPGGWQQVDLKTVLPAGSPFWQLSTAFDINESGQIVGLGSVAGDGVAHVFLLTPAVPEPASWSLLALGLVVLARRLRGR